MYQPFIKITAYFHTIHACKLDKNVTLTSLVSVQNTINEMKRRGAPRIENVAKNVRVINFID